MLGDTQSHNGFVNTLGVRVYFTTQAKPAAEVPFSYGIPFRLPSWKEGRYAEVMADVDKFLAYDPARQEKTSPTSGGFDFDQASARMPNVPVNQFYYPCGAQRYGVFRGFMDGASYAAFQKLFAATGDPSNPPKSWGWFVIERVDWGNANYAYGPPDSAGATTNHRIATPMRPLKAQPVSVTTGDMSLWLVTLVDERYFWQDVRFDDAQAVPNYPNVIAQLNSLVFYSGAAVSLFDPAASSGTSAGIGTTLDGSTTGDGYSAGGSGSANANCYINTDLLYDADWDIQDSPIIPNIQAGVGAYLDTAYAHLGQVIVRDWNGNVRADTYRKANADAANNHKLNSIYTQYGGLLYTGAVGTISTDMLAQLPAKFLYATGECFLVDDPTDPTGVIAYNPNLPFGNRYGKRFQRTQTAYPINMALGAPYCQMTADQVAGCYGLCDMTDTILRPTLSGGEDSNVTGNGLMIQAIVDEVARVTIGNYCESLLCPVEGQYRGVPYWEPDGSTDLLFDLSLKTGVSCRVQRRPRWLSRHEYYRHYLDLSDLPGGGSSGSGSPFYTFTATCQDGSMHTYTYTLNANGTLGTITAES